MTNMLLDWHGSSKGVTIGTEYDVSNGSFKDDLGNIRYSEHGEWEEVRGRIQEQLGKGSPTAGPLSEDPMVNPKKAAGAVKAPMHTVPTLAMIELSGVMAGGAHKYGYHNFRESQVDAQTYIGAMNRHFLKWQDGVDFDNESGQHELAHLMACCAIMIDAQYTGKLIDNRSKTGLVEEALRRAEENFSKFIKENKSIEEKMNERN